MYYSWEAIISSEECEKIIEQYKNETLKHGSIGESKKDKTGAIDLEKRNALIHWVSVESLLNRSVASFMQEANEQFFKYNMEGSEQVQFAKYEVGGKYCWHTDAVDTTLNKYRKLSTIVQLSNSDDYEGGDFQFYNGDKPPEDLNRRQQGSVIVFDSKDWHRLTPITGGVRYSLAQWSQGARFV